jgi:hypothetical protein
MVGPNDMRRCLTAVTPLAAALAIACSSSDDVTGPVAAGAWGGVGISLVATEQGAQLEFDCALGTADRSARTRCWRASQPRTRASSTAIK